MKLITSPLLLAFLTPLLSITILAIPIAVRSATTLTATSMSTDANASTPVLENLTSESLLHHYASNLHVPTVKISRAEQAEQQGQYCAPIGFKNWHKICDSRCDPTNCNNLPGRGVLEGNVEGGEERETDEHDVKGKGKGDGKGGRVGHWYMNSPPIEKRRHLVIPM
ncbi:hypothetical protein ONS95_001034 [Cadophora gregata]|uniref:uncharacterized protein n=1 Tax=Cadophora gregata TaxID=51156 RepID=UPI0026DB6358|nr:uncharacterized protein ONS95_001034 [Cadophora gregata]KAK0102169.1 hypothetical protein ONS96_006132 [Cadophora gregata f. sp. sojae]KAK0129096.1 hypothetical protein ONS95_001034 [Cadophora gregata]